MISMDKNWTMLIPGSFRKGDAIFFSLTLLTGARGKKSKFWKLQFGKLSSGRQTAESDKELLVKNQHGT